MVNFHVGSNKDELTRLKPAALPQAVCISCDDRVNRKHVSGIPALKRHLLVPLDRHQSDNASSNHPKCTIESARGELFDPTVPVEKA